MSPRPARGRPDRVPERLISAVVPGPARPTPPFVVPLPGLPAPPRPRSAEPIPIVGTARVDRSGRLRHSGILHALRWRPGEDMDVDLTEASADDVTALLITPAPISTGPSRPTGATCRPRTDPPRPAGSTPAARSHYRLIVLPTATAAGLLMSVSTLLAPDADPHRRPSRDNHEGHRDER